VCLWGLRTPGIRQIAPIEKYQITAAEAYDGWRFLEVDLISANLHEEGVFGDKTGKVTYSELREVSSEPLTYLGIPMASGQRVRVKGEMELWKVGDRWLVADSGEPSLLYSKEPGFSRAKKYRLMQNPRAD
jgi:hypothetical protein